jgi:phosphoglycerate dehydrogenase-like enzyme
MGMSEAQVAELREASPSNVNIVHITDRNTSIDVVAVVADAPRDGGRREALLKEVAEADAIIGTPSKEIVVAAKKLRWLQITSAGAEEYIYPEIVNSNIVLTNAKTLSSEAIADHGLGMLLMLTRNLNNFLLAQQDESWVRKDYSLQELNQKTAVIIGTGGIGSAVAARVKASGMKVIGVDPKEFPPRPDFDRMVFPDRLDQVLPEADVVFLCAPHTKDSEKMYGPKQFELMKQGSYFIGLSRGKVYNLDALVKALDSKRLAGAGVDVTDPEPLPKGHPLWKFENVIITPHIATQGESGTPLRIELYKENLIRFGRGEQLRNVVDKQKGY